MMRDESLLLRKQPKQKRVSRPLAERGLRDPKARAPVLAPAVVRKGSILLAYACLSANGTVQRAGSDD